MGWDAYCDVERVYKHPNMRVPANTKLRQQFKAASEYVKKKAGNVDCLLEGGGLDCDDCAKMLEKATGKSCWPEKGIWTSSEVHALKGTQNWNFKFEPADAWAYWSARKFLRVCIANGCIIRFSY